ncbi:MAG TPA: divergent polysaccharide deacetylase family protein [Aurantimonas sp.]
MHGELYEPLGLDLDDGNLRRRPSASALGGLAVAALVVAGSLATAILGQPERRVTDYFAEASQAIAAEPIAATTVIAAPAPVTKSKLPIVISGPDDPALHEGGGLGFRIEDPVSYRQSPSVAHLPDPDLIEESAHGPLPTRGADGRRPFDVYAGSSSGTPGARIAIVVGGLGISQSGTLNALNALPAAVTLGFAPAGNSLGRWMQDARRGGHELLLQVPLEPVGYPQIDPGQNTVTVADAAAGDLDALHASLGRITNYVGIMNYMGGRFTGDPSAMEPLIAELGRRGLMYLDDSSSLRSLAKDTAMLRNVPVAASNVMIDETQDPADIRGQLDTLERIARAEGSAIGVASAFDASVAVIAEWTAEASGRGIEFVPVSALAVDTERR